MTDTVYVIIRNDFLLLTIRSVHPSENVTITPESQLDEMGMSFQRMLSECNAHMKFIPL